MGIDIRVLGPTEVTVEGRPVELGGPRQRRLLVALAIEAGTVVSADRLIDRVWSNGDLPANPRAALRTYLTRLRQAIGDEGTVVTEPAGWRIDAERASIDADRFRALVEGAGEPGLDVHDRLARLDEALRLWRGQPLEEVADDDWARPEADRLEELRLATVERRYEAMLAAGMHTDALPGLVGEAEAHPLRDRLVGLQMLALFRTGRQAEASRVFQDHRDQLAEELGLEPSDELVELDRRIVAGDPSLLLEATTGRPLRGYRLGEQLGQGAFAVVFRGSQPSLGRDVAVKIIRQELANRPEFVRRFEAEAHLVARLEHPYIVPLYDYWREPDRACLVFRYLRGGTLESHLTSTGGLTPTEAVALVDQVGSALAAAHRTGVVHRDVKPANVFLDEEGNFYLGDFGIALEAAELSDPTAALSAGSPAYASPEQLRREPIGPSADVHGLGITLYEALTGRLPFPEARTQAELLQRQLHDPVPTVADQRRDLPPGIDEVLARATAKDPAQRYQTVEELVAHFRAALQVPGAVPEPMVSGRAGAVTAVSADEDRNPYKGLRAFDEADAGDFFGRERLVERLVGVFDRTGPEGRIAAVVGPSGIGKSSVVRAGLLPALRRGAVPGSDGWFVATMLPGSDPFQELASALLRVATSVPDNLMSQLTEDTRGIARVVKAIAPGGSGPGTEPSRGDVMVVIDQFEELFTLVDDDTVVRRFLDALEHAVGDARCPLRVVLTMRADFWDRPLRHGSFARLIEHSTVNVTALAPDELERAITEPAHRTGAEFEPGLVSEITADVADQPGALPLLQYALTELWDRRVSGLLTRDAYCDLGGVAGALARRADELYVEAAADEQTAIRRLFGRLVTPGEGTEDTRRRALRSELATGPEAGAVIDRYGAARLLSFDTDPSTREPTVEVAHEALIRQWPRLRDWLSDDRDGLRLLRHLHGAAIEWEAAGRPEAELYRGGRLEAAEEWAGGRRSDLTALEREFLDTSSDLRTREEAEEQEHYHEQVRSNRRLRQLLAGLAVFLAVALVAGAVALQQRGRANRAAADAESARLDAEASAAEANSASGEANEQAELATARAEQLDFRRLIAESANQVEIDRRRGLLLALEAHGMSPGPESLGAIQRVLVGSPTNWLGTIGGPVATYHGVAIAGPDHLVAAGPDGLDVIDLDTRIVEASFPLQHALSDTERVQVSGVKVDGISTGDVVAMTSPTGEWQVVDVTAGTISASGLVDGAIKAMDLSDDGRLLALGLDSGSIHLIPLTSPLTSSDTDPATIIETGAAIDVLQLDAGARRVATLHGVVQPGQVWDVATGSLLVERLPTADVGPVGAMALAWRGDDLLLGGRDRTILFDPDTATVVIDDLGVRSGLAGRAYVDVGPDGALMLTGNAGIIEVLRPDATRFDLLTEAAQVGQPEDIAYHPDQELVALAGSTGIALISTDGRGVLVEHRLPLAGRFPAMTEDGTTLASRADTSPPLELWQLGSDPQRAEVFPTYTFGLGRGDELFVSGPDGTSPYGSIGVWKDGSVAPADIDANNFAFTYALSPDGRWAVVSTWIDGKVQVFDRRDGQLVTELDAVIRHTSESANAQAYFAPDLEFHPSRSELVVTLRDGGRVHFYDTTTWTESRDPLPTGQGFYQIDFTSDGRFALTIDYERGLELRSADTYEVLRGPELPLGSFARGMQNPEILDGDRYAVVGSDIEGTIVWDIEEWAPVGDPIPFETDYRPMAVAPEAKLVAGVLGTETLVWNVDVETWVDRACLAAGRNLTAEEWETYGPDRPYRRTCPDFP